VSSVRRLVSRARTGAPASPRHDGRRIPHAGRAQPAPAADGTVHVAAARPSAAPAHYHRCPDPSRDGPRGGACPLRRAASTRAPGRSTRGLRLQREQTLVRDGRQLGRQRAWAFRERRDLRAGNLGFDGLEDYLRQRYVTQRVRIEDLASELDASVAPYAAIWPATPSAWPATRRDAARPPRIARYLRARGV
jgi:hypothetical protein